MEKGSNYGEVSEEGSNYYFVKGTGVSIRLFEKSE
jgi:hypothetical protein